MIADLLEKSDLYASMDDRLAVAFRYLQTTDLASLENGKYEVEGKEVYAVVSEYNTKDVAEAKWEAHRNYADVQVIIKGEEKMGFAPLSALEVKEDYNPDKDIVILKGTGDYVTVKPGMFAVFFPHDGHQPCVAVNGSAPVKKVVVKVLM